MSLKIVEKREQIATVALLAREIWFEHYAPFLGEAAVSHMVSTFQSAEAIEKAIQNGTLYYLFESDSLPVGYAAFEVREDYLYISKLYLKSTSRGKGFGRKMLEFAKELAKKQQKNRLRLNVNANNKHSISVYRAAGFFIKKAVRVDMGGGFMMHDYVMEFCENEPLPPSFCERATKLFFDGYSCSQAVALAYADLFDVDKTAIERIAGSFGAGFGCHQEICGALSGIGIVAGLLHAGNFLDREQKTAHYQLLKDLSERFAAKNGAVRCSDILKNVNDVRFDGIPEVRDAAYYQKRPCAKVVANATAVIAEVFNLF